MRPGARSGTSEGNKYTLDVELLHAIKPDVRVAPRADAAMECRARAHAFRVRRAPPLARLHPALQESKVAIKPRNIHVHLVKKEAERWDGLLKDKSAGRTNVKCDWDRWVDSDDEAEGRNQFDMSNFDGMDFGGMGGMGGMGDMGM